MDRIRQIINEEISAITKNKKKEIFDYHSITEDSWIDPKKEAQEFQRITFDFENDDSTGQKKTFNAKVMLRKDQPVKNVINAELMEANGDWEMPVLYFRIQFAHQYGLINNKYGKDPEFIWDVCDKHGNLVHGSGSRYVLIPPVEAGNKLVKGKSDSGKYDWFAYQNNELSKEEEKEARLTDGDKRKAWEWLKELLEKLIMDRHEMLDNNDSVPKDIAKPINENKSKYAEVKDSLLKSKSIGADMKTEILKYLTSGSKYHEGGRVTGLIKPKEMTSKSNKSSGVSMGADKDGFYVYTHRARSKSHPTPDKITVKEINFIDSTG